MELSRWAPLAAILGLASVISACTGSASVDGGTATAALSPLATQGAGPTAPIVTAQSPDSAADPARLARLIIAAWLGVPEDKIMVVRTEEVEWPDASLGCPQEGQFYAQVIVPGYRITLEAGGVEYVVHTDLRGAAVVCGDDGAPLPEFPVTPGEIDDGQPWMPVE
jgi:hypothetical protein